MLEVFFLVVVKKGNCDYCLIVVLFHCFSLSGHSQLKLNRMVFFLAQVRDFGCFFEKSLDRVFYGCIM